MTKYKSVKDLLTIIQTQDRGLEDIIEMFQPLIRAYSFKSGWKIESEDMQSLLTIRLIEVAKTMKISEKDGENVNYIATAIRFHFLNIVKRINRIQDNEQLNFEDTFGEVSIDNTDTIFDDMISILDSQKQYILKLKFKGMFTDIEIANILGKSRQSVHKQLKNAYKQLVKYNIYDARGE